MNKDTSLTVEEILQQRRKHLEKLRSEGKAYPNNFDRSCTIAGASKHENLDEISLAGRFVGRRTAGKAIFANIADASDQIQIYANKENEQALAWLMEVDFGDIVGITGSLFTTRLGELTVKVKDAHIISKCLQNYTPKVAPTDDIVNKRRYLALSLQKELRNRFSMRSKLNSELRSIFDKHGYLEVETPMLHAVQGGAAAKPFETFHQALDRKYFLRIAPELYLKRLIVGGYDKVFEINRSFRNEGMSDQHNPEFTMLEFYAAYKNYRDLMVFTEDMLKELTKHNWRSDEQEHKPGILTMAGVTIDFNKQFKVQRLEDSICEKHDWTKEQVKDADFLRKFVTRFEGEKSKNAQDADLGRLQFLIFEKTVEDTLIQPTFIIDYPASVSPLSRRSDKDPTVAERFELFIGGRELANGFSELNDPDEQERVFKEQQLRADRGDEEAMQIDEDYILALSYAMPPAAGEGIGIDRLAMMLMGCDSIRDVILFPQQRPESQS